MKTGKLRDRIELWTVTSVPDGEGGSTATYALFATRYADVRQISQSEALRSGLVAADNIYQITLRRGYNETLDRTLQIRHSGKRMNINSVVEDTFSFVITAASIA
jgi:head-tail adaptor